MALANTCNLLGRAPKITAGSGGFIAGSLAVTQVAYGSAANTIKGDAAYTFTEGTGVLKLGVTGSSANSVSITGSSTGALSFAAAGTNQSLTLTPSGTAPVIISGGGFVAPGANAKGFLIGESTFGLQIGGQGSTADVTILNKNGSGAMIVPTGTQNILLGGLTVNGTGVLQFPAATTSAGGITLGTDVNFFRSAANAAQISASSGLTLSGSLYLTGSDASIGRPTGGAIGFYSSNTEYARFTASGGFSIASGSSGVVALTLDSLQNATGVGYLNGSQFRAVAKTQAASPYAVSATTDNRQVFTNEGTSALVTFNLPTAVANLDYTFVVQDADGIRVVANTGDTIRIAGSVSASAGRIDSTTVGSTVRIIAINSTEWVSVATGGTWSIT